MSDLKSEEIGYGSQIGSGGSDAILASFFRAILLDLNITIGRFGDLIDRSIIRRGLATNSAEISTSRSALRRELLSQTMTWKVFIKGLTFLRIEKVKMELTLFRDDSKLSVHEYNFEVEKEVNAREEDSDPTDDELGNANLLARFFREILTNVDMNFRMFQEYLDHYVQYAKPGAKPQEQYTAKCSLKREILKPSISWKVFVKGLIFLKTSRVVFRLKLTHANGVITRHEKIVSFR